MMEDEIGMIDVLRNTQRYRFTLIRYQSWARLLVRCENGNNSWDLNDSLIRREFTDSGYELAMIDNFLFLVKTTMN